MQHGHRSQEERRLAFARGYAPELSEGMRIKAAVYTEYGPPNVLEVKEIEKPTPNDDEVLIKVVAATVNRTDCGVLRAKPFVVRFFYGLRKPRHAILGNEFAGQIESVGRSVTLFRTGDDVFGYNDATFSAHAEYMTMPEYGMMATMPASLTYEEAAPTAEGAH